MTPSNLLPFTYRIEQHGTTWQFIYQAADARIVYTYEPKTGTLDDFTVQLDETPPFQPALGGGATATIQQGDKVASLPMREGKLLECKSGSDGLKAIWEYKANDQPIRLQWTFQIRGKALEISVNSETTAVSSFSLGNIGPVALRKTLKVPYFDGQLSYLPVHHAHVCRMLDWTVSNSSQSPDGVASYHPKTDGTRNPLAETGYIAVSPDLGEVLPNIPFTPSPYLATLSPRIILDARTWFDLPYLKANPSIDFSEHTNPTDTWIDFGPVATNGSIKINCHKNRLVVFPYPRDKKFGVSLDLKAIAADADLARVQIRALAAGDQRDLGPVEFKQENNRLVFEVGTAKAGRYEVSW